jgi:hypothetical protein
MLSRAAEPLPLRKAIDAPGVAYTTTEAAPGLKLFSCTIFRGTFSTKTCAARWARAQVAKGEELDRLFRCRTCTIGACHAGYGEIRYSAHHASSICPRCGKGTMRMIGNRICVSCYNRSRELRSGKNARGNVPIELLQRPLPRADVLVEVAAEKNGVPSYEVRRLRDRESSGVAEVMVHTLRTMTGVSAFGFAAPPLPRAEEFAAEAAARDAARLAVRLYRRQLFAGSALRPWSQR